MWGQNYYWQSPGYSPYSYGDMYTPPPCNQEDDEMKEILKLMIVKMERMEEGINRMDEIVQLQGQKLAELSSALAYADYDDGPSSIIPDLVGECEVEDEESSEVYVYNTVHHEVIDPRAASDSDSDSDWDDIVKPIQLVPRIIPESWHEWESVDIVSLWPNDIEDVFVEERTHKCAENVMLPLVEDLCLDEACHESRKLLHGAEEIPQFYAVYELPPTIPRQTLGKEAVKTVLLAITVPRGILFPHDRSLMILPLKNWRKKKKRKDTRGHDVVNKFSRRPVIKEWKHKRKKIFEAVFYNFFAPYASHACSLEKRQKEKRWWKKKKWREKCPSLI